MLNPYRLYHILHSSCIGYRYTPSVRSHASWLAVFAPVMLACHEIRRTDPTVCYRTIYRCTCCTLHRLQLRTVTTAARSPHTAYWLFPQQALRHAKGHTTQNDKAAFKLSILATSVKTLTTLLQRNNIEQHKNTNAKEPN